MNKKLKISLTVGNQFLTEAVDINVNARFNCARRDIEKGVLRIGETITSSLFKLKSNAVIVSFIFACKRCGLLL